MIDMSSRYAVLASIDTTSDLIEAEPGPMERISTTLEAQQHSSTALRRLLAKSAYEARLAFPPQQIAEQTGIPWWTLRRLVTEHLEANPHLPRPKPIINNADIPHIDLSGGLPNPHPHE